MPINSNSPEPITSALSDDLCNCLSIRRAARRLTQAYDQALAPAGLRATQFSLLALLHQAGSLPMGRLASRLGMDRATLGHNLRPLMARGLVAQSIGSDRRARPLLLTSDGRAALAAALPGWRAAQENFENRFGAAAAAEMRGIMHRVAALTQKTP